MYYGNPYGIALPALPGPLAQVQEMAMTNTVTKAGGLALLYGIPVMLLAKKKKTKKMASQTAVAGIAAIFIGQMLD